MTAAAVLDLCGAHWDYTRWVLGDICHCAKFGKKLIDRLRATHWTPLDY